MLFANAFTSVELLMTTPNGSEFSARNFFNDVIWLAWVVIPNFISMGSTPKLRSNIKSISAPCFVR